MYDPPPPPVRAAIELTLMILPPRALLAKLPDGGAACGEGRAYVHSDVPVEQLICYIGDVYARDLITGVVDQNIHSAEPRHGLGNQALYCARFCYVALNQQRCAATLLHICGNQLGFGAAAAVMNSHFGSIGAHAARDSRANAAAGPGDKANLAGDFECIHALSPSANCASGAIIILSDKRYRCRSRNGSATS